jgi:MFS transporter, OCT family, solute carrier family 22 (organic cation transporter), member 4/5
MTVIGFTLSGLGASSATNTIFVMMNDHSLGKFREYTMAGVNLIYSAGGCLLVLIYIISPHFRIIMLCIGLPILLSCVCFFWTYESPLFLYEKSKEKAV